MSLLFDVVYRNECRSTHHKLVMDALRQLRGERAEAWRRLFLRYYEPLLQGAKDPDDSFRDFRNHVLHARDNMWGGVPTAAKRWYHLTVNALRQGQWPTAVYAFGVLSHYYTDALQPLHTAQSEREAAVHRAAEWSICKSYAQLLALADEQGLPDVSLPEGGDWLRGLMEQGAGQAVAHYDALVAHYDLTAGKRHPPAGLSEDLRKRIAEMIGLSITGLARILERAIQEAGAAPPRASNTVLGVLTGLTAPFAWIAQWRWNRRERRAIEAIEREYRKTGRVRRCLPAEQRVVRRLHAEEVLGISEEELDRRGDAEADARAESQAIADHRPAAPRVMVGGDGAPAKNSWSINLTPDQPVVDAPSIGAKTARRLERIGVHTVGDLLRAEPADVSRKLGVAYITTELVQLWRLQASLVCEIPNIHGHDAQWLAACGLSGSREVAAEEPGRLLESVRAVAATDDGQRILRGGKPPDLNEVSAWIQWARHAQPVAA